jgi:hypothetical protein
MAEGYEFNQLPGGRETGGTRRSRDQTVLIEATRTCEATEWSRSTSRVTMYRNMYERDVAVVTAAPVIPAVILVEFFFVRERSAMPCLMILAFTYTQLHHSRPFVDLHVHRGATLNIQPSLAFALPCLDLTSPHTSQHFPPPFQSPSLATSTTTTHHHPVHPNDPSHPDPSCAAETREPAAQSHEPLPFPCIHSNSPDYALISTRAHSFLLNRWQTCQRHTMSSAITVRITLIAISPIQPPS